MPKTTSKRAYRQGPITRSRAKKKKKSRCLICAKIVDVFKALIDHDQHKYVDLGSPEDVILNSHCTLHRDIMRWYLGPYDSEIMQRVDRFICWVNHHNFVHIKFDEGYIRPLHLVPILGPSMTQLTAKSLHPHWIERGLFNRWRLTCDSILKDDCRQAFAKNRLLGTRPAWLIDTWTLCLVDGNRDDSYVALSYLWGPPDFFQTLERDLDMLQRRHALSNSQLGLPQTIVDAFAVTQLLEQRYLWVDSLCIVQDDHNMKQAQIQNMSYIYSQATITIIAKQGNTAKYGLRGLPGISQHRSISQDIFQFGRKYSVLEPAEERQDCQEWHHRGWTFQEEVFSRRQLIFSDDRVWWKCHCSSFQEDLHVQSGRSNWVSCRRILTSRDFNSDIPYPDGWRSHISQFNTRLFTNPEDVVPAFAGITTVLAHSFHGGFLYGLPIIFFDTFLCWQPRHTSAKSRANCQRRQPRHLSARGKNPLPSWSWMGWVTDIDYGLCSDDYVRTCTSGYYRGSSAQDKVISTIQWYSRTRDSPDLRAITGPQLLQAILAEANKKDGSLPVGWHRTEFKDRAQPRTEHSGPVGPLPPEFVYRHESEPKREFWFPAPTAHDPPSPPARLHDSLLCCRTQKATLYIGNRHLDGYDTNSRICHALLDQRQQWSGIIQVHSSEQLLLDNNVLPNRCDLVVISKGYMWEEIGGRYFPEWDLVERPRGKLGKYEFFNVLWVEWEDGIAYRKGCGRVMKSAWEAQNPEMIDLTLG